MASLSHALVVECRMALGLTQGELGALLGRTKRTVQRWEDRGALLLASEVEALARALHSTRPDLAARVAAAFETTLDQLGLATPRAPASSDAADRIESVVRAAADAMGTTPDAVRPAVAAAFGRAREHGLDVDAVALGLAPGEKPHAP